MDRPRSLITPFRRRLLLLALALLTLLPAVAHTPAQAQERALERGEWRRALLSQGARTASYSFTATEASRIGVVGLDAKIEVDITPDTGACGVAGDPRHFQNIACDSTNGTYTIILTLDESYSGGAVAAYVRFDYQAERSFTPINPSSGTLNFSIGANSVNVFSYNYSSGPSRHCVKLGSSDGLSHQLSTRRGALIDYNLPGDAKNNERPSYRLDDDNSPHYLIVYNSRNSGVTTTIRLSSRTSSNPC